MSETMTRAIRFGAMLPVALRQWTTWHPRAMATWTVLDRMENGFHSPSVAILFSFNEDASDGWQMIATVSLSAEAEPRWWETLTSDVARAVSSATRYLTAVEAAERTAKTRQTRVRR